MAKNKSGSLDTNILLRLVIGDVPEQTTLIEKLFEQAAILSVADMVIFEMVFVLERFYKFSREDIVESVYTVIRHEKINCNRTLFERSLRIYQENKNVSFVNCTLPQYASINNAEPLFTFDKHLAKSSNLVTLLE